jgi:hypothetical protein
MQASETLQQNFKGWNISKGCGKRRKIHQRVNIKPGKE